MVTLAVPFFGFNPHFSILLSRWWRLYEATNTAVKAVVITDEVTPQDINIPCLRVKVDTSLMRPLNTPGHAFDYKGALIVAAAQQLTGNVLFLDSDAFLRADPAPWLSGMSPEVVAMREDTWQPPIVVLRWADYETARIQNAGVIWIGRMIDRPTLAADYARHFRQLACDHGKSPWLEQYAWSALWTEYGRADLPKQLNWSHLLPEDPSSAVIYHAHGEEKWKGLAV